jgi:hypothetical protein
MKQINVALICKLFFKVNCFSKAINLLNVQETFRSNFNSQDTKQYVPLKHWYPYTQIQICHKSEEHITKIWLKRKLLQPVISHAVNMEEAATNWTEMVNLTNGMILLL